MRDLFKMLQDAQAMQTRLEQMQNELAQKSVSGSAGGGMVTVEADGRGQIKRIKLDPLAVNPADLEMLEDLIVVAVADAQKKAQQLAQEEMSKLTGGLNLPFKLPFA
ncbi:MAG: YbaB/EbfC family nucleoid-associated protein [Gemmatimonadaceae bacterium]